MPVNAHVIEHRVGDAVEELYDLFTIKYFYNWQVTCQNVNSFLLHLGIRAYLDVEHVGTCTASRPAFDDRFGIYDVTFPAVVWGK